MRDWLELTAADQGRGIAAGDIDPRDLVEAYLAEIAETSDAPKIYARLTPRRARAEAAAAAERAREGRRIGPLDGVPISWKDNIDSAGIATEAGSRLLADRVPETDAAVLARATAAGLVCLGKTHLSELAFSGLGINPMAKTPPNVFVPEAAPGGSSSGAAVSVARRLAAAAVGSDTGGSVRIPAAWNGLVGLKTTAGLLPNRGVVPLAPSLDTIGPLARTVEDAWLLLAALFGRPGDPLPAPARPGCLLVPTTVVFEGADAAVIAAFEAGITALSRLGVEIRRGPVPELEAVFDVAARLSPIVTFEAWEAWGAAISANPGVMYNRIETRFRQGEGADPGPVAAAKTEFRRLGAQLAERMAAEGPVAMPTVACLPPRVAELEADEAAYTERNLLALRNTRIANLLGLSAVTLPLAEPATGLMLFEGPMAEHRLVAESLALAPALTA
ncbi:MAG: amidase [Pikeienuella sp.]